MLQSRTRVLCKNGFLGVLLTHMRMVVDEHLPTAATDGTYIYFGKDFLENLNDREMDFVMMHEIMHVVLRHLERTGNRNHYLFNIASDIVINSTILESAGGDERAIHLGKYGTAMHLAPDGKEGAKYTAEEVYEQLKKELEKQEKKQGGQSGSGGQNSQNSQSGQDGLGEQDDRQNGEENSGSEQSQDGVKNAEQVKPSRWHKGGCSDKSFDEHDRWKKGEPDPFEKDVWQKRIMDAAESASRRGWGNVPAGVERSLGALKNPQTDWRTLLQAFIQEDITDYSFSPPDRRYDGGDFFMPDFNEKEETVRNILFMIDTSGSMSKAMLTAAYSEVKGAIDQFGGVLKGYLGFFDAAVADPKPFSDEEDFKVITPVGGGGTSFAIIFDYIEEKMSEELPACIIILTDGYAPFPEEERTQGIPVLWIINNEEVTPPWGVVARIKA
jgi:predicted metal-dependent peptidase